MTEDFRILIVCTANIVRSPMAEVIARAMLRTSRCPIEVTSAGTEARTDAGMAPHAIETLRSLRLDGRAHRARPLTPALVQKADLVLTMETRHRGQAVTLVPTAVHRAFTLREFAYLAERCHSPIRSDSVRRARAMVDLAAAGRAGPARRPIEIPDPYGGPPEDYVRCAEVIGDALSRALGALLGPRRAAGRRVRTDPPPRAHHS